MWPHSNIAHSHLLRSLTQLRKTLLILTASGHTAISLIYISSFCNRKVGPWNKGLAIMTCAEVMCASWVRALRDNRNKLPLPLFSSPPAGRWLSQKQTYWLRDRNHINNDRSAFQTGLWTPGIIHKFFFCLTHCVFRSLSYCNLACTLCDPKLSTTFAGQIFPKFSCDLSGFSF